MCERTWCADCGEELIHRDNRHFYESASGFGQIVHRDGPKTFTFIDIDGCVRKWFGNVTLLRLVEHKQPHQKMGDPQRRALLDLEAVIRHAVECPNAPLRLDERSGVFKIVGPIVAATTGRRRTEFGGPQLVIPPAGPKVELATAADVFGWLDGDAS